MPENNASHAAIWLAEECARQLTQVLDAMNGETFTVSFTEAQEIDGSANRDDVLWWEQSFNVAPGSPMWVGAVERSWQEIGNRVLRSAGVEDGESAIIRSTYLEIVRQAVSGTLEILSTRSGRKAVCLEGREDSPSASTDALRFSFEIKVEEQVFPILMFFSQPLVHLQEGPLPAPVAVAIASGFPEIPDGPLGAKPGSIELLLDVELPVSVSFGRAHLPLKDVIKLTCGSIVELSRSVSEPVDVIVNNCVIARGEVVVVEGNFGIRISQVISRQERLRTLY
jgi:flagellar motor switch protein FliN